MSNPSLVRDAGDVVAHAPGHDVEAILARVVAHGKSPDPVLGLVEEDGLEDGQVGLVLVHQVDGKRPATKRRHSIKSVQPCNKQKSLLI